MLHSIETRLVISEITHADRQTDGQNAFISRALMKITHKNRT